MRGERFFLSKSDPSGLKSVPKVGFKSASGRDIKWLNTFYSKSQKFIGKVALNCLLYLYPYLFVLQFFKALKKKVGGS